MKFSGKVHYFSATHERLLRALLSTMAVTQEVDIGTLLLAAILCIAVWAWHRIQKAKEEEQERHERQQRSYGSTTSNHDHQKRQYRSRDEANEVIERMHGQGLDGNGTLRSYYNSDYGRWFVGNGGW